MWYQSSSSGFGLPCPIPVSESQAWVTGIYNIKINLASNLHVYFISQLHF